MRTVVPLEEQLRMDAQPELDIQNQLPLINSQPQSPHNHAFAQLVVNAIHDPNASSHNFNPHAHDHALSIQSIIAASKHQQQQATQLAGQQPTWHIPQHSPVMPPQTQQRDLPAASSSRPVSPLPFLVATSRVHTFNRIPTNESSTTPTPRTLTQRYAASCANMSSQTLPAQSR